MRFFLLFYILSNWPKLFFVVCSCNVLGVLDEMRMGR
jgi:hypothetical protein